MQNLPSGFLPYFLLFIWPFGPTVAGILVSYWFQAKDGLKTLLDQLVTFKLPGK